MHVGIAMFCTDYAMPPKELAVALEERGFESLWLPVVTTNEVEGSQRC